MKQNMEIENTTSDVDLDGRLSFIEIDQQDCESLRSLKTVIERELPKGLDRFYEKVRANPETKRFFSSENHMQSAKSAQAGHWDSIANGRFDKQYAARVTKIGSVHADIGLLPRWYIGGYGVLTDQLIHGVVKEFWPKGGLFSKAKHGPDEIAERLSALIRAIYLDMDLSISVYMDKAEEAKKKRRSTPCCAPSSSTGRGWRQTWQHHGACRAVATEAGDRCAEGRSQSSLACTFPRTANARNPGQCRPRHDKRGLGRVLIGRTRPLHPASKNRPCRVKATFA